MNFLGEERDLAKVYASLSQISLIILTLISPWIGPKDSTKLPSDVHYEILPKILPRIPRNFFDDFFRN